MKEQQKAIISPILKKLTIGQSFEFYRKDYASIDNAIYRLKCKGKSFTRKACGDKLKVTRVG